MSVHKKAAGVALGASAIALLLLSEPICAQGLFGGSWGSGNSRGQNSWGFGNQRMNTMSRSYNQGADGDDVGSGWIPSKPPRQSSSSSSSSGGTVNLDWLPGLIDGIDRAVRNSNRNDYYRQPTRNYYQPEVRRTYRPQTVTIPDKPVAANTMPKPVEKINATRDNKEPEGADIPAIDDATFNLAGDVVEAKAQESIDDVEKELGDIAKDDAVEGKLDELRDKVANGEQITDQDKQELQDLVGKVPGSDTLDGDALDKAFTDLQGLAEANSQLNKPFPPGGPPQTLPEGIISVLMMPGLPEDEMLMMPDGGVMMGTGGQGQIGLASADASELLGLPVGVGDPVPETEADIATRVKSGTYLLNPSANGTVVNYLINNHEYTMQPGYSQQLAAGQTWVIRFDRGGGHGEASYTLSDGTWALEPTANGWDLVRKTFAVTIDNTKSDAPFYYNIDNSQEEVAAGANKQHTSDYPILVRFDRGGGGNEAKKLAASADSRFVVGVSSKDGLWDLFSGENYDKLAKKTEDDKRGKTLSRAKAALLRERLKLSLSGE